MIIRAEQKRQFPRARLLSSVRFQIRGNPEMKSAVCDNVSVRGLSFVSDHFIPPETHLNLELNVLSRVVNSCGSVVWAQPLPHSDRYRFGVQFVDCNPQQLRYLADYVGMHAQGA